MKKDQLDEPTADLIDQLVDVYTSLEHAYSEADENGIEHLMIKCSGNKVYRIKVEYVTSALPAAPWSN